jgi:hypothetical protein
METLAQLTGKICDWSSWVITGKYNLAPLWRLMYPKKPAEEDRQPLPQRKEEQQPLPLGKEEEEQQKRKEKEIRKSEN